MNFWPPKPGKTLITSTMSSVAADSGTRRSGATSALIVIVGETPCCRSSAQSAMRSFDLVDQLRQPRIALRQFARPAQHLDVEAELARRPPSRTAARRSKDP